MRSFSTRTAGLLILILGVWGGIVPFIGHYFHFALGPDKAWSWTMGRLWLDILPAVAAIVAGLMLIGAGPRPHARLGAWLAIAAGIWFAIGPEISVWWKAGGDQGVGHGSAHIQALEMLAYHTGLGALIAALGGFALPRFRVVAAEAAVARAAAGGAVAERGWRARRRRRRLARDEAVAGGAAAVPAAAATDAPTRAERAPAMAADAPSTGATAPAPTTAAPSETTAAPSGTQRTAVGDPATAAGGQTATPAGQPVATRTAAGHSTMRRRRGGLFSVFSRH
jgi:hypothetical protein